MTNHIHQGWRRHMRWSREERWMELPDTPEWVCIPIHEGAMDLVTGADLLTAGSAYGGWDRGVLGPDMNTVAGRVEVLAWPELAAYVLGASLTRNADPLSPDCHDLASFTIDIFTPPDPRRYAGAKVEILDIVATPRDLRFGLSLRAATETPNDTLTPEAFSYETLTPGPFSLRAAALTVAGNLLTDIEWFRITADNALESGPNDGGRIAFLLAGPRTVRLELTRLHDRDTFNEAVRNGTPVSFAATLVHPAGHEISVAIPRLYVRTSREDAPPQGVAHTTPRLEASGEDGEPSLEWEVRLT